MHGETKSVKAGKEMAPVPRKDIVNIPITSRNYTWPHPSSAVKKLKPKTDTSFSTCTPPRMQQEETGVMKMSLKS